MERRDAVRLLDRDTNTRRTRGRWTGWYNLGVWASDSSTIERHSVKRQGDADGDVAVDTLVISSQAPAAGALQIKLRLFSQDGTIVPTVRSASVSYSSTKPVKQPASSPVDPGVRGKVLPVPACSQMVYAGGDEWCSPTSTSMVLAYWAGDSGLCEPRVRSAVAGVYDWMDDGYGTGRTALATPPRRDSRRMSSASVAWWSLSRGSGQESLSW